MKNIVKVFMKLLCLYCLIIFSVIPSNATIIDLAGHNPNSSICQPIGVTEKDITGYTINNDYSFTISLTDVGVKKVNAALTAPTDFDSLSMYYKDIYMGHSKEHALIPPGSNKLTFDYAGFALVRPEIDNPEEILKNYMKEAGIKGGIVSEIVDNVKNYTTLFVCNHSLILIILLLLFFLGIIHFLKLGDIFKFSLNSEQQVFSKQNVWKGLTCIVILLVVGLGIYNGIEVNSLPKCDSDFAVKEVEEIYKQNSQIYNYQNSVGQVMTLIVDSPRIDHYDKDANKYYCLATIKLHVTGHYSNGFTHYNTDVFYNISKSRGKPVVFARFEGKGRLGLY